MLQSYCRTTHHLKNPSISDSSADGVRGGVQLVRPPVNHRDDSFTFTKTLDCTKKLQHQNKTHADTAAHANS